MKSDLHGPGQSLAAPDFTIGPWLLHGQLHRLSTDGQTHQLEPKVSEVLLHLARHAGQVVSRVELQEKVWGSQYISEDLPRRAIYELRKVLGDNPRAPTYIETIPRAGYRLIAPVAPAAPTAPVTPTAPAAPSAPAVPIATLDRESKNLAPTTPATGRWFDWRIAIVLLAATALAFNMLRSKTAEPNRVAATLAASDLATPVTLTPLTSWPGLEYDPAYSPDGSRIAYLRTSDSEVDAQISLHVQLPGSETSLRLNDLPADFDHPIESPTWSPDGTTLAYLRWHEKRWWIYQVPALGGSERPLLDLRTTRARGLSWSPDGRWLALGLRQHPNEPYRLHRVSIDSLELEPLTQPPTTVPGDIFPAWSPDGESLAFLRKLAPDTDEIHIVDAAGGTSRSLLPEPHKIAAFDWTPDSQRLVLVLFGSGRHHLWTLPVDGGQPKRFAGFGENARWVSVARHAPRMAYGRSRFEFGVWRTDLASGESRPMPMLSSTHYDEGLDLDPEGQRVALVSTRSGAYEVWVSDLEGRRPLRLTSFEGPTVGHPRWSPDGRQLAFHANSDSHFDLWTIAADGSSLERLTQPSTDDRVPSWSADGRHLYFASSRSGQWQVWKMPATGGDAEQVTRDGGYHAQVSAAGELYYTRWQTHGLWRLAPGGGEDQVLGDELRSWEWGNWCLTEDGIYFVARDASSQPYLAWAALPGSSKEAGGSSRRVLTFEATPVSPSLALAPDGGWLLFAQLDRIESDITLVEGWSD